MLEVQTSKKYLTIVGVTFKCLEFMIMSGLVEMFNCMLLGDVKIVTVRLCGSTGNLVGTDISTV